MEFNPVRAGMVESVLDYPWSSARAHCGLDALPAQRNLNDWRRRDSAQPWTEVLGLGFRHSGDLDRLRQATRTGRPFGTPDFVAELEEKLERTLQPKKRGRKPRAEQEPEPTSAKNARNAS